MRQIELEATPLSTVALQHVQSEPSLMLPDAAAVRTMPNAEAMTAPRARDQRRPPARPDRRPSPRGGHPAPSTASAAGRPAGLPRLAGARRGLVRSARVLAAVAWLSLLGALALPAPAQAQTTGICDRTQQVHEKIVSALSGVDDCAAVTDADLAGITTLSGLAFAMIDSLKSGDFAGLTSLTELGLAGNNLTMLPADVFSGLTALITLGLNTNKLESLRADVFSGLTSLTDLSLALNSLTMLPADVFSGLTALTTLNLRSNALNALPDGLFSGLTALTILNLGENPTDPLPLTVTVEKVGTDQARARVLAGAPFAVDIPVTVANGALAGSATALSVAAGSVEGTEVTVTRTAGTTAAVTVDVDLTTPLTLPANHTGYIFKKATTNLPATILPDTTTGICDRTQQVRDAIVSLIPSVSNCADVTATHLAGIDTLYLPYAGLTALKAGDFDGLTALTLLWLPENGLTELPARVFDDLTALETLFLGHNALTELPAGVFDNLTALTWLQLQENALTELPAGVFDNLTALTVLELATIGLISLPAGVFDNNTALERLYLGNNGLTSLPAGVFNELIALSWLGLTNNSLTELPPRVFDNNTALERLELGHNALNALPDGLFSGLTALTTVELNDNATNPLQLTVTVEKVGTDQARAKVLAGAPFAVDIPVTLVDGTLDGGATTLRVETGSVEGTAVTVTRKAGTTAAVTVDVDLTTQPVLPSEHQGYAFARASSGLPATVLPVYTAPPTVESVAVNSWPVRGGDAYGFGDTIVFTLTFSEKVRVTGQPQPKLVFDLGGSKYEARYHGLSDTDYVQDGSAPQPRPEAKKLHFAYTVKPGDSDGDGVEVGELSSAIDLGGARIQSAADLVDADGHKVDGVDADLAHSARGPLSAPVDGGLAGALRDSGVTIIDTDGNPLELQANGKHRLVIRESTRGRYGFKLNTRPTHRVDLVGGPSDGDEERRGSADIADLHATADLAGQVGDPAVGGYRGGARRR